MSEYTTEDWLTAPKGAQNGMFGGIKLLLDNELFDFSFTGKESAGFRIGFSDPRDKAMIKQDGYLISSGERNFNNFTLLSKYCTTNGF